MLGNAEVGSSWWVHASVRVSVTSWCERWRRCDSLPPMCLQLSPGHKTILSRLSPVSAKFLCCHGESGDWCIDGSILEGCWQHCGHGSCRSHHDAAWDHHQWRQKRFGRAIYELVASMPDVHPSDLLQYHWNARGAMPKHGSGDSRVENVVRLATGGGWLWLYARLHSSQTHEGAGEFQKSSSWIRCLWKFHGHAGGASVHLGALLSAARSIGRRSSFVSLSVLGAFSCAAVDGWLLHLSRWSQDRWFEGRRGGRWFELGEWGELRLFQRPRKRLATTIQWVAPTVKPYAWRDPNGSRKHHRYASTDDCGQWILCPSWGGGCPQGWRCPISTEARPLHNEP